jgi:hypothetical protein
MRCVYCAAFIAGVAAMIPVVWMSSESGAVPVAGPPAPAQPVAPVAAEAPKPAAGNADADTWGTLKGQLVYDGPNVPVQKPLKVNKDEGHCLAKGPILEHEWIVNQQNKGVKNVFVWLAADPNGPVKTLPIHPNLKDVPKAPHVIDQPQCMFEPYASGMREGQTLIVKNNAPVAHNANYAGSRLRNPGSNPIVPAGGQVTITLKSDRFPVRLSCNIHPWMKGFVGVYDHPYFALTDADGNFEIKLAPAGGFRAFFWHEGAGWRLGEKGGQGEPVTIKAGQTTDLGKLPIKESN